MTTERREDHTEWRRGACICSFMDSGDEGEGDLMGVLSWMDCLAGLGTDVVWTTPFFPSPMHDAGCDVSDDRQADPRFGTLQDPEGIRLWPHDRGRNGVRTPFPWEDTDQLGFSKSACTWRPCEPFHAALSVARQDRLSGSVLECCHALIALRRANAVLRYGSFEPAEHERDWLVFFLVHEEQMLMCAVNFSDSLRSVLWHDQVTALSREYHEAALPAMAT